jgi:UDP-GlcNAc:undecaprenyl-phosphate/decaprenyl-phosphate GlcNAc-1-phosphate transferase
MAMAQLILIPGFLIAVLTAVLFTPFVYRWALRNGWVDAPDGRRKLHTRPTPRVGGIAIVAGFMAGLGYFVLVKDQLPFEIPLPTAATILGGVAIVLTGFLDDVRGLNFKQKFVVQVIAAYLLLHAGYRIDVSFLPFVGEDPYQQALISIPLTLLWIVGIINAVNLLDGLDGLAAGVVMIAFVCLAVMFGLQGDMGVVVLALPAIGAITGFLVYNFNPASIFMGDSGSLFLGYILAAYSLRVQGHAAPEIAPLVLLVVLGLPVLDTGLAMVRRFATHKAIFAPDHDHIHHRLKRILSHRWAVLILYGSASIFGTVAVLMTMVSLTTGIVLFGLILVTAYAGIHRLGYVQEFAASRRAVEAGSSGDGIAHSETLPEPVLSSRNTVRTLTRRESLWPSSQPDVAGTLH